MEKLSKVCVLAKLKSSRKDCWLHSTETFGALCFWNSYRQILKWSLIRVALEQGPIFPSSHRLGMCYPQQKTPVPGSLEACFSVAKGTPAAAPFTWTCTAPNRGLP